MIISHLEIYIEPSTGSLIIKQICDDIKDVIEIEKKEVLAFAISVNDVIEKNKP